MLLKAFKHVGARAAPELRFFKRQVYDNNSVLHYLLPPKRNLHVIDKLRHAKSYELVQMRTDRFKKSFIPHYLASYQ